MFNYTTLGSPTDQPLIFLHGFMGNYQDWNTITKTLKNHFYCICIDLPGHGSSPNISDKETFFLFMKALIIKQSSPYIVGYSMGGRVALDLLYHHSELFSHLKGLVLESSHPGLHDKSDKQQRLINDQKLLSSISDQAALQFFLQKWYRVPLFGNISSHPDFKQLIQNKKVSSVQNWQDSLDCWSLGRQEDCSSVLQELSTYFIYGEHDLKYRQIAKTLKCECKTHVIKGAAHNTHYEQPNNFIEVLLNFF